jgi:UDP-N-acetylglucosamine--N-acetylmuramyl-(pentapeptide) pyrophosphoryl-undecaprenol N-acetylglucosamine transferase
MKFAFGGGGTGGHVIPALALADVLVAKGHTAFFIGNANSIEERLSTTESYQFCPIKVQKLYRGIRLSNLTLPFMLLKAILQARSVLRIESPDAVVCTGGFVSGPVVIAASLLRIPLFCHESNSYPGLVTRTMARFITRIYISFDATRKYLSKASLVNYGIPIRISKSSNFSLADIGLDNAKPTILVTGGSQGSLAINKVVDLTLKQLIQRGYQVIWQTGRSTFSQFAQKHHDTPGVHIFDFSAHLTCMLSVADIAITRAGAMTIAELEEYKTPAILIPLPTAAENHQYYNALEQQKKGVAKLLNQSELTPNALIDTIESVESHLHSYKENLANLHPNNAATLIAEDILAALSEHKSSPIKGA